MPYTTPDIDQFIERYPSFVGIDEDYFDAVMVDALTYVSEDWAEGDYQPALLNLVAHMVTTEKNANAGFAGTIQSESFGPISRTYAVNSGDFSQVSGTEYGRRFLALRRRNFPAVLVI